MTFTLQLRLACSRILNRLGFATLTVDPAGADNSVLYTAREAGAGGEDISVAYAAPSGASLVVAVVGNAITVTPRLTGSISTAGEVIAAVNAFPAAFALVTASESGASTGPVAAVAAANLIYLEVLTLAGLALTLSGVTLTID